MKLRRLPAVLGLAAVAAFLASRSDVYAGSSKDKKDKGPHLKYAATYAEGIAEAKARNTILYAVFHKDH